MSNRFVSQSTMSQFGLWEKIENRRFPLSFDLEVTARCNNNCRHCYINLPPGDREAQSSELRLEEIGRIADEAISLGSLSCLITGGEPLLRPDFADIYLCLKKKGLLLSVFTNATLLTPQHVELFKKYPPRDLEVTVYGVSKETYAAVTRAPENFSRFLRGLDLLIESGIRFRLKAMALRSNVHELPRISAFCREKTKDFYRFDPFLHLRFDRNEERNAEIRGERLSTEEVIVVEQGDAERFHSLKTGCNLIAEKISHGDCNHLFHCGLGRQSFSVSYHGIFRPCSSLWHPECVYDLRKGSLQEAWEKFTPQVLDRRTDNEAFKTSCQHCRLFALCLWCPAHAYLETGQLDERVDIFCRTAKARARMLDPGGDF